VNLISYESSHEMNDLIKLSEDILGLDLMSGGFSYTQISIKKAYNSV
jgi:hypothetical protein